MALTLRLGLLVTTLTLVGTTGSAQAARDEERPTVLILPFEHNGQAGTDSGYAAQLRTYGVLTALRTLNLLHPKQLNRVLERYEGRLKDLEEDARLRQLGSVLGADFVLYGTIDEKPGQTQIKLSLSPTHSSAPQAMILKAKDLIRAFDELRGALVSLMANTGVFAITGQPQVPEINQVSPVTSNLKALLEYTGCHRVVIRQPIGILDPVVIDTKSIDQAIQRCLAALKADPNFADAKAALALAYALNGNQQQAERYLAQVKGSAVFLPLYWLGKFWILSRHYDIDLALRALDESIEKNPGFLLARGYLGESQIALGRYQEAIDTFKAYVATAPRQSFAMGRLGYAASKMGKLDESLEWTKKGLAITPSDPELLLELSSRFVDAKRFEDAATVLRRVISEGHARGEVHLRLGFALLKLKDYRAAELESQQAIEIAKAPAEWRTRGRARYNLAKLWVESGNLDNAMRQLRMAVEEGFKDRKAFETDPDMKPLVDHPDYAKLMKGTAKRGVVVPTYVSAFGQATEDGSLMLSDRRTKDDSVYSRF